MLEFFNEAGQQVKWTGEPVVMRVSVYALIEREILSRPLELLLVRTKTSPFLELPGGGVDAGRETVSEALSRECAEEIGTGANISIGQDRPLWQDEGGFCASSGRWAGTFFHAFRFWYLASAQVTPSVSDDNPEIAGIVMADLRVIEQHLSEIHPIHRSAVRLLHRKRFGVNGGKHAVL
jgi:8-oxo-dGTP pyrophosphatase MutT (NUDIX family)